MSKSYRTRRVSYGMIPEKYASSSTGDIPYKNFRYQVEIDGMSDKIGFSRVSGMQLIHTPYKYQEGGNYLSETILPGQFTYSPITFIRGLTGNKEIWNWIIHATQLDRDLIVKGLYKRNMSISLFDKSFARDFNYGGGVIMPIRRWDVFGAIPVSYEIGDFDALASDVAIEKLVIQHSGFEASPTFI